MVERRIDLDVAVREIEARAKLWRANGITVGDVTWRDQAEGWPWVLKTNRAEVRDGDSIGARCTKGDQEGAVVLFTGGWADLEYWSGDVDEEPLMEIVGYGEWLSLESFGVLLDRFGALFR
jgi:hypothetical protein